MMGAAARAAVIEAVAEVGNPTVVATLTVIAALLPMLFVSGLMGPYMAPIPANASAAMLFSFFVAMVVAPWLMLKLAPHTASAAHAEHGEGALGRIYRAVAAPIIRRRWRAWLFLLLVGARHGRRLRAVLHPGRHGQAAAVRQQVGADACSSICRRGSSLEATERTLFDIARITEALPEVTRMQAYAGTAQPFDFNGLVRHSYLRQSPELGELQFELAAQGASRPQQPRGRARSAPAAGRADAAGGRGAEGRRGAARPARARDAARRSLWPGRDDAARGGRRS